jgi:hypothetical protein
MRANSYKQVTEEEIRECLGKWTQVQPEGTRELCFEFPLRDGVVLRCMTSVSAGVARKKGGDAIRVFALDTKRGKGYISTKRVYRTQRWSDNLRKAGLAVFTEAKARLQQQGR